MDGCLFLKGFLPPRPLPRHAQSWPEAPCGVSPWILISPPRELQRQTAERARLPQDGLAHFLSAGRHVGGVGSKAPPFLERGSSLETKSESTPGV